MKFDLFESRDIEHPMTSATGQMFFKHTDHRSGSMYIGDIRTNVPEANTLLLMGMLMAFNEKVRKRSLLPYLMINDLSGETDSYVVACQVRKWIPDFKFTMSNGVAIEPGGDIFKLSVPKLKVNAKRYAEYLILHIGYYNHLKYDIKEYGKRYEIRDR